MSQEEYIKKVLERFSVDKAKEVSSPLATYFKLRNVLQIKKMKIWKEFFMPK